MTNLSVPLRQVGAFSRGIWRYWRRSEPSPESNFVVEKLFALTDGRSNDILFQLLEAKRREKDFTLGWDYAPSLISDAGALDPSIDDVAFNLREDGVAVIPPRLNVGAIERLYELALSCQLSTATYAPPPADHIPGTNTTMPIAETGTTRGFDPLQPGYSSYYVPREQLLENEIIQRLLCDPYLLAVATRYLGVFPVITKPEMWWDTDLVPSGLRPRPFHTDSGCLRWLKVGVNLTETTLETPHFVYVKGSHKPNRNTRPLTRHFARRLNLSDKEVTDVCHENILHFTAPAGSITLADTRGIHKGELSLQGHRLILYFGLEGSAFNNIDRPMRVKSDHLCSELDRAMSTRPFSYQFFHIIH